MRKSLKLLRIKMVTISHLGHLSDLFYLFLGFLLLCPLGLPSYAQEPVSQILRISPVIINISLSPNKTYVYPITLENLLNESLPVKAAFEDFQQEDEEGGYIFPQTTKSALISWSSLESTNYILKPHEKRREILTIKTPAKIPVGGYYAILFFEPLLPSYNTTTATILQTKIGIPMMANIGVISNDKNKAAITEFRFDKYIYQKGPVSIRFKVKNIILNHLSAKPSLTIQPLFGKTKVIPLEEKLIFPGKIRAWNHQLKLDDYWHGVYKMTLKVSTGQGQSITKSQSIIAIPLTPILLIISVILLLIIVIRKRTRIKKAISIILSIDKHTK